MIQKHCFECGTALIEKELEEEGIVPYLIGTSEYDYPAFHLSMDCFWCEVVSGDLVLKEAEAAANSGQPVTRKNEVIAM